jgi:hypothetical protein
MTTENLQSKFDELISKYMTLKKQIFDSVMRDQTNRDKYYNFYGKNVIYDGAYWYINEHGVAHKYKQGGKAWQNKSKTCPNKISGEADLTDFTIGPDMVENQACGVAGNNIMNESTGEVSWVDIEGNKHIYSTDAYNNRNPVCNKEPIIISSIEYDAIPEGPPMTKDDFCLTSNINKDDYKKMQNLNEQIISIAKELVQSNDIMATQDKQQQKNVEKQRRKILEKLKKMELEKISIDKKIDKINTLNKEIDDFKLKNRMYNTRILTYILSGALITYMAVRIVS